jgi:adenylosuccinate synthase
LSVLDLGFGDCGKGLFTDYLCRRTGAYTVVRFNGGAQAAHNVVLPDGRHHTFSQFGAGTFVAGTVTILAYPVVVHPGALLVEHEYLQRSGVRDGLHRLLIDGRCRVTTPYHQAAGRMRELERGDGAHGSCGVGAGETVRHALAHPDEVLSYACLADRAQALAKLEAIRRTLRAGFGRTCRAPGNQGRYAAELAMLDDASMSMRWLDSLQPMLKAVRPAPREAIAERLRRPGAVVFEGAQGLLLDEWRGFHPHTTWSSTGPASAEAVAADAGQGARIEHFGVLRTYLTRHGHGPLPSHDALLDRLPEPHNAAGHWQGEFRRGHPDAVLLRYALSVAGHLDGLFVSHLDAFDSEAGLRWCSSYQPGDAGAPEGLVECGEAGRITGLVPSAGRDLAHQARLANLLSGVRPHLESEPIKHAAGFIEQLEAHAGLSVLLGSYGPTHRAVRMLQASRAAAGLFKA